MRKRAKPILILLWSLCLLLPVISVYTAGGAADPASKTAPPTLAGEQPRPESRATFLTEDFEVSVPPPGWTLVQTNPDSTWYQSTTSYYSGLASAEIHWDPALVPQNEQLITPAMDLSLADPSTLVVTFWWQISYYWAVDPYDNYDLELWISTDGGESWPTMLWTEDSVGVFENWTWYQAEVSLAGYTLPNVKLSFRYVGVDGAQANIDLASVSDVSEPGDNCGDPFMVTLGPGDLPYTIANQTTCGRGNNYDETCLGSYDGGEDMIIQLNVTGGMYVDIQLDPKGTTYTGIAIDNLCPPGGDCMGFSVNPSGSPHSIIGVTLAPGIYYLMVDTWPSPTCIPDFDVVIMQAPEPPENDTCENATPVGNVYQLPFSTTNASSDDDGACMESPNIWYCFTPECDGDVTVSLCGSSYDTKLGVYDGCTCNPLGTVIECNDDFCGLQSQITFSAIQGNDYLIEVGGYSSSTGDGVLSIFSCGSVGGFSFEQLDFLDEDGTVVVDNSDWGYVSFDIYPASDGVVRYFNISARVGTDSGWIVRNYPILPDTFIGPGRYGLDFDLKEVGVFPGMDADTMWFGFEVSLTLQPTNPGIPCILPAAIDDASIREFGAVLEEGLPEFTGPGILVPPYWTDMVDTDSLRKYTGLTDFDEVPSVQEGNNECGAGAMARSLKWLSNENDLGLGSAQGMQDELDNPEYMNAGATGKQMAQAKKKYIEDNNLPLEVHWWNSDDYYDGHDSWRDTPGIPSESSGDIDLIDWIWREMGKGQDIEIFIRWDNTNRGHIVVVVGIDKKNKKIEYRDDKAQGDDTSGDTDVPEAELVPLGNGEYGFRAAGNRIISAFAESPKSFDLGWRYHPRYVDGWLTVYGTINCQTIEPPLFDRTYVESCHTYKGDIPDWANDYLIIFEWDWFCNNVDSLKVARPYWDDYFGLWRLFPFGLYLDANLPEDGVILPAIGDEFGETQQIHTVVNIEEWLADPRPIQEDYFIINGECDDLPGYLIGTTPIVFDSLAPPRENPFSTTPYTGMLHCDAEIMFEAKPQYICGDADANGLVNIADVVYLINYIFGGGPPPDPLLAGDVDCNALVNIADVVYLINYIFGGGPEPCADCP